MVNTRTGGRITAAVELKVLTIFTPSGGCSEDLDALRSSRKFCFECVQIFSQIEKMEQQLTLFHPTFDFFNLHFSRVP